MDTPTEARADVDELVTRAVVEKLLGEETRDEIIGELLDEEASELTEFQIGYLKSTVARTLDQLAIPFIESLSSQNRDFYRDVLRAREPDHRESSHGTQQD